MISTNSSFSSSQPATSANVTLLPLESLAVDLPKSNVLKYTLSDGSWFVLRPSGTEPKAKVYIGVIADVIDAADAQVAKIKEDVLARVNEIIA